jgi:serine/threonine protein kinase
MARAGQSDAKRREKFEQERHILRMLRTYRHSQVDHVVTHHRGSFFILFPLATCNLKRYMELLPDQDQLPNCKVPIMMPYAEGSRTPDLNRKFALWILTQLAGLAEGIQRVHALARVGDSNSLAVPTSSVPDATGYHHDIKPDNILVFVDENERNDYGTFKIGDFGSGRAEMLTRSGLYRSFRETQEARVSPLITDKSNGAPTYTAPDHYLTGNMSRASDMWSLGCVFLEILTWAFLPHQTNSRSFSTERFTHNMPRSGPTDFVDDRFWCATTSEQSPGGANNTIKPSATINAAVLKQLARLERIFPEGQGTSPFGIVVRCTKRMLVVDRAHRIDAVQLGNALDAAVFNANVVLCTKDNTLKKEDTDPYPQPWQEPVLGSGPYVEPFLAPTEAFPTPTSAAADTRDLPDLNRSSTNGNFLSPHTSRTSHRQQSAAVNATAILLAGEGAGEPERGSLDAEDQQNEDKLDLDAPASESVATDGTSRELIVGQPRDPSQSSATPQPALPSP